MRYEIFLNFCDGSPGGEWTKLKQRMLADGLDGRSVWAVTQELSDGSLIAVSRTGAVSTLPASDRYASGDPQPGQWRERPPIEAAKPVFESGAN